MALRNRIKGHRRVKVRDLVPHELNPRQHPDAQKAALRDLLGEIGFARSVLAYELPDGRLKLIDGHLRQEAIDPNEEIDVEILDVSDEEAKRLLLTIDPLAQLADYDDTALESLKSSVSFASDTVNALIDSLSGNARSVTEQLEKVKGRQKQDRRGDEITSYKVLIECEDENQQRRLLNRCKREGLLAKALID